MNKKKKLGIIGGMGPAASVLFYDLVTRLTPADCDQDHIDIALLSLASTPDRSSYVVGTSPDSPLPALLSAAESLNSPAIGADYIAVPCVTAHYFIEELRAASKAPVISMVEETAAVLRTAGISRAAVLATEGTVQSGIFPAVFGGAGIEVAELSPESRAAVTAAIAAIKAGQSVDFAEALAWTADECRSKGAGAILLACTELSLLRNKSADCADCMEILARRCVELCGDSAQGLCP